jgi:hypothetical protein
MPSRPLGITILAILLAVSGLLQILVGLEARGITHLGLIAATDAAGISGWTAIVSGVLTIVVSLGLFTLAGWAWLLTVAVMAVRIVGDVLTIATLGLNSTAGSAAIGQLVLSGIVLWYFMRPGVKSAFGR